MISEWLVLALWAVIFCSTWQIMVLKLLALIQTQTKQKHLKSSARPNTIVKGVNTIAGNGNAITKPRKIMLLVPAGKPVDNVIEKLYPLLSKGDIIIDGGNSHYTDTLVRLKKLQEAELHFMGIGVSGGEEGARLVRVLCQEEMKKLMNKLNPYWNQLQQKKTESHV